MEHFHLIKYHEYLSYQERPVPYTLMTRRLREVARLSENITEPEEWEHIADLLQDLEKELWKLGAQSA